MDHRDAVEFVARRLRQSAGALVERVILYGSVARGEAGPDSDVDLVVIAREFRPVYRALRPILGQLIMKGAPLVSVLVLTTEEFGELERRRASSYQTLEEEGETIVA